MTILRHHILKAEIMYMHARRVHLLFMTLYVNTDVIRSWKTSVFTYNVKAHRTVLLDWNGQKHSS